MHEGPQRISKLGGTALEPGMILSNEPGYYKAGAYGIRIENLVLVETRAIEGAEREMRGFETLTLAPFDRTLIDVPLLTPDEIAWIDAYHARVRADAVAARRREDASVARGRDAPHPSPRGEGGTNGFSIRRGVGSSRGAGRYRDRA